MSRLGGDIRASQLKFISLCEGKESSRGVGGERKEKRLRYSPLRKRRIGDLAAPEGDLCTKGEKDNTL